MKIAYFDCFAGISGDMTLGALIDAGADAGRLKSALASLEIDGCDITVGRKMAGFIAATDVRVAVTPDRHHHRRLKEILAVIDGAPLSDAVKLTARRIFARLAEAEGRIHGITPEEVHFHEVGAVDAIVDIVGTALCLEMLGWPKVVASPMPTFHGYVKGSHGLLPLPAPATAEILRGVPWRKLDIEGELVTPTGAAIVRETAAAFGPLPAMTVESIGYGAGKSDFGIPNTLRVLVGEELAPRRAAQAVAVIETNTADPTPHSYDRARARPCAPGPRDVFLIPIQMKKNRPGTLLSVLCDPSRAEALAAVVLSETSSLGVRISHQERICLDRRWEEVATEFGTIRIKIGERGGSVITAAPEYEDCKRAAREHGVAIRRVYDSAMAHHRAKSTPTA